MLLHIYLQHYTSLVVSLQIYCPLYKSVLQFRLIQPTANLPNMMYSSMTFVSFL